MQIVGVWVVALHETEKHEIVVESIEQIASAISVPGGESSVRLQLAEKYLKQLRTLADSKTHVLLPADLTNLDGLLKSIELEGLGENS